ncbi:MAG: hypothetical protein Q7K40_02785 [bacterium]|nr:hypothetical protein [bacterium]
MALSEEKQIKIVESYCKDKLSIGQIVSKFKMPASTVAYYLNKHKVKMRSRSEAVTTWYITEFAKKPFVLKKNLSQREKALKLAGVMLYWAEGAKGGGTVKFVNSDPAMIKLFMSFLRVVCGISESRLKLLLHLYPDHNDKDLRKFWASITGVPESNFYQSYVHIGKTGTYKNKSIYGTLAVNYSDKKLLTQINSWTKEYQKIMTS